LRMNGRDRLWRERDGEERRGNNGGLRDRRWCEREKRREKGMGNVGGLKKRRVWGNRGVRVIKKKGEKIKKRKKKICTYLARAGLPWSYRGYAGTAVDPFQRVYLTAVLPRVRWDRGRPLSEGVFDRGYAGTSWVASHAAPDLTSRHDADERI